MQTVFMVRLFDGGFLQRLGDDLAGCRTTFFKHKALFMSAEEVGRALDILPEHWRPEVVDLDVVERWVPSESLATVDGCLRRISLDLSDDVDAQFLRSMFSSLLDQLKTINARRGAHWLRGCGNEE